ncbi:hypothetical protein C3L33_18449, partial [Rhododendron williamsianum]
MKARGIEPDVITYTVLIDGHSKEKMKDSCLPNAEGNKGEQNEVATLWSEMKEIEQKPDVISYTVLIDCHCKSDNLEDATVLFDEMIDRGLEPDNVTYTALLCGYCRRGYTDRAVTLLNDMIFKGIQPDSHTMSALHHGILQAKKKVQLWHEGPVEDEDGRSLLNCDSKIGLKRYMTRKLLDQDFFSDCSCILCAAISEHEVVHAMFVFNPMYTILTADLLFFIIRSDKQMDGRKLERVNDLYNWLDSAYSYLAMDPANFMMPLPGNPIKEVCRKVDNRPEGTSACTEMVMPMSTSQNTTMYPASDFNYTYYKEDCWNSAHHLDLRAATAEDPDWLLEQRASEIKLVEGWLHDYYREKKAVFAS